MLTIVLQRVHTLMLGFISPFPKLKQEPLNVSLPHGQNIMKPPSSFCSFVCIHECGSVPAFFQLLYIPHPFISTSDKNELRKWVLPSEWEGDRALSLPPGVHNLPSSSISLFNPSMPFTRNNVGRYTILVCLRCKLLVNFVNSTISDRIHCEVVPAFKLGRLPGIIARLAAAAAGELAKLINENE